jgi:8-oxo-dGTP pyrophosphatase MutT (NUDIX family)
MKLEFDERLRQRVRDNLAGFERQAVHEPELRPAAVAILLTDDTQGRGCFVLTRRPLTMRRHAGQYALPGGRLDPGESPVEAALRETEEEIGLALSEEAVIGLLDDFATRSGFCISPVVVWAGAGLRLRPNPDEVAAIHRVPLSDLLQPDLVHLGAIPESERPVLSLSLLDNRIFAPTAALLLQLREVALLNKQTRVSGYEQPRFAWR